MLHINIVTYIIYVHVHNGWKMNGHFGKKISFLPIKTPINFHFTMDLTPLYIYFIIN